MERKDVVDRLARARYEFEYRGQTSPRDPIPEDFIYDAEETVYLLAKVGLRVVKA